MRTPLVCAFDPEAFRSPQRVWDAKKRRYVAEWDTTAEFELILCDGRKIIVPNNFRYNKGSVPRIFWPLMPRDDSAGVIAWQVHDLLYDDKYRPPGFTRAEADQIMLELLIFGGMSEARALAAYYAVRSAFWKNW